MLLLTISEFRNNISQYMQRAANERISVKTKHGVFDITPSKEIRTNPSPSGDPWFDVPENLLQSNAEKLMSWLVVLLLGTKYEKKLKIGCKNEIQR